MTPVDTTFAGRTSELGLLAARLERVRTGIPTVALVEGPPGIGKSALVRRWLTEAGVVDVVEVSGDEAETRLAYGVVHQLADRLGATAEDIAAPGDDPLVAGTRLIEVLASGRADDAARVLVIDDAHWADQPSLQALTFALRRQVAEPVLTIVVARTDAGLTEGLRRLADGQHGQRLVLGGLSTTELAQLAADVTGLHLDERVAERLREHTNGNPLHAQALLTELDPEVLRRPSGPLPAPRSYATLVLARLRACPADAERLVTAAAVLGGPCPLSLAARVGGVEVPLTALQAAVDAELLAPAVASGAIAFPHALVRAAVYHDLGASRRSALHLAAAEALPTSAALDHRIAAAVEDAELAEEVVRQAREEAATGAIATAAGHLLDAGRLAPRSGERESLVAEAALLLLQGGMVSEAAVLAAQLEGAEASCQRSFLLGLLALFAGHQGEAERLLVEVWDGREAIPDTLAAQAAAHLAQLCSIQVRHEDTLLWARRAMDVSGDQYLPPAFSVYVCHLWFANRREEAQAVLDGEPSLLGPAAASELLLVRALTKLWTDDPVGARSDLVTSVQRCQPLLSSRSGLIALGYLSEAEFRAGDWDASMARSTQAVSLGTDAEQNWTTAFLHGVAALPLAGRGSWSRAEVHVRVALDAAAALGDVASIAHAGAAAMFLALCRNQPGRVVDAATPLLEARRRLSLDYPGVHYRWPMLLAEALLDLGRVDEAEQAVAGYAAEAAARTLRIPQADAARVQGQIHASRREVELASASFERAEALLNGLSAPFELALIRLAHGALLRRAGKRREAASRLSAAEEQLRALGARPLLERCEREIAACGLAPARRSTDDVRRRLTPQELTVAHLVTTGATNREVAAELVVSTKTVEYHLANLFRKLDVTSRAELTATFESAARPPA